MQSLPSKILEWIKQNKLAAALIALLLFMAFKHNRVPFWMNGIESAPSMGYDASYDTTMAVEAMPAPMMAEKRMMTMPMAGGGMGGAPIQDMYNPADRMIATDTNVSLKVNDVRETLNKITAVAFENGGFMVNSNMNSPEGASSGSISIKVQAEKLPQALDMIRGLGVKVVYEYVNGTDVTDQYSDIEEQLRILTATKEKMETILNSASKVQDMLEVQRELIGIQAQIDSLKGQQQYLDKTTQLASVSVYLSTDELALPYAPDKSWRPQQVYKEAVRSLIQTGRNVADLLIWIGVYAPLWIPAGLLLWFWQKRRHTS